MNHPSQGEGPQPPPENCQAVRSGIDASFLAEPSNNAGQRGDLCRVRKGGQATRQKHVSFAVHVDVKAKCASDNVLQGGGTPLFYLVPNRRQAVRQGDLNVSGEVVIF